MVEYAGITAGLTLFFSSLAGVFGSLLPANELKAATLISAAARSSHVSAAQVRTAYAQASYPQPALRYLFALGWLDSAAHLGTCRASLLLGPNPTSSATQALEASPKLLLKLRALRITVGEAASAVAAGVNAGCPS